MKKILYLVKASKKDIGFDDVKIGDVPYRDYMKERGIIFPDPEVLQSCHRTPELVEHYSGQMQAQIKKGNRVVGVSQGGLYFGLPSIQSTQVTFPIISDPTDLVAYQGFLVPSGTPGVGGVGVDYPVHRVEGSDEQVYATAQRGKALLMAERMLNLEDTSVDLLFDVEDKAHKELTKLGIEAHKGFSGARLAVSHGKHYDSERDYPHILLWADGPQIENLDRARYIDESHRRHNFQTPTGLQCRGPANLAVYTLRILSLQRPELGKKITDMVQKDIDDVPKRDLEKELEAM